LRGPEPLPFEALVLRFQRGDNRVPVHCSSVLVHFAVDLDGLQFEGKHITLQKCGCS
jgi:hypothetical protein